MQSTTFNTLQKKQKHIYDRFIRLKLENQTTINDSQEKLEGFFAAAGPDIQGRGDLGEVEVLDMAPTWLQLLGVAPSADMKGKIIKNMVKRT